MPQRRSWKPPKQDHSVYVQQLFKDFLVRNNGKTANVASKDTGTNFARTETAVQQRKQPGIFDRAVYARFERDANGACFKRQEPAAGFKTGLMKWIDQQHHQRKQGFVQPTTTRSDDYLNLPDNFFSGVEQLKLPIEVADRTLVNVTNNFIPPSTSTPFDKMASFGVSGVLSDPDEFQPNEGTAPNDSMLKEWESFLKNVDEYLLSLTKDEIGTSLLDAQKKELEDLIREGSSAGRTEATVHKSKQPMLRPQDVFKDVRKSPCLQKDDFERPSWREHSLISNQNYLHHRNLGSDTAIPAVTFACPRPDIPDVSYAEPLHETRINRPNVTFLMEPFTPTAGTRDSSEDDILLTASPPSPALATTANHSLFNDHFLPDQTRTDDTLMAKLDALLNEDDFDNPPGGLDFDFDFASQCNQTMMNITFPNRSRRTNDFLDESIACGKGADETQLYLSQDLAMASTFPELREALF